MPVKRHVGMECAHLVAGPKKFSQAAGLIADKVCAGMHGRFMTCRNMRSTASCLLANTSMRARTRCDLDPNTYAVKQPEARPYVRIKYRTPWKLEV